MEFYASQHGLPFGELAMNSLLTIVGQFVDEVAGSVQSLRKETKRDNDKVLAQFVNHVCGHCHLQRLTPTTSDTCEQSFFISFLDF